MIELYTFGSTNGHKVAIALEELTLPYRTKTIEVFSGEGRSPDFLALNPAGKIPVIVDLETGVRLTESAAILLYLADKAGRLIPPPGQARWRAIELLYLQASLQGPMFGQRMHFSIFAEESIPYAISRYEDQCKTIDELCDHLLRDGPYFLGEHYSVVDIAFFAWYHAAQHAGFSFEPLLHLSEWYFRISERPAAQRGVAVPSRLPKLPARKTA